MTSGPKRSRRDYGDGSYRQRGDSWELKYRATDPKTGQRATRYKSFKGTEIAARAELRKLVKQAEEGAYLAPARQTFGEVLNAWEAGLTVGVKTAERYKELVALHVRPHLGEVKLQTLRTSRIESFYRDLREGHGPGGAPAGRPLSARTVGHIHRLIVQALALAQRDRMIAINPAREAKRPKVERTEVEILAETDARDVLEKVRGRKLYLLVVMALATGMRRGELLALRWKDVDLEGASLRVEQSLEQTKAGLRFKEPKTRYSRRRISLPASLVAELRAHWSEQAQERLKLGLGREPTDGLVFRHIDGEGKFSPLLPNSVTTEWRRNVSVLKLPKVSFHALRHTHASQLIASGMDILTISRRLGHGSPSITLDVYGHLFKRQDEDAAAVFESAFSRVLTRTPADENANANGGN